MHSAARTARRSIGSAQFNDAVRHVFGNQPASRLPKTGLAVSGGVDSMALLFLWTRFMKQNGIDPRTTSKVFLVDHKARPNSTDEARKVADSIKQLTNLNTQILTLDWGSKNPHNMSNFESQARRLRYQALGRACLREGISQLLLGHHEGDSMETILYRISQEHYGDALAGVARIAQLPECEGEYGIYESGSPIPFTSPRKAQPWCYESEGVTLLRPLLSFSKKDLISTCEAHGVTWFEDATNHDPSFTRRNAIRSIVNSGGLPEALSTERLRTLVTTISSRRAEVEEQRDYYLSKCVVQSFDLRCGTLRIFLPRFGDILPNISRSTSFAAKYHLCCAIVQYLINLVSPEEKVKLLTLGPMVNAIFKSEFPELSMIHSFQPAFSVAGTIIAALDIRSQSKKPRWRMEMSQQSQSYESTISQLNAAQKHGQSLWRFCRSAISRRVPRPALLFAPLEGEDIDVHSVMDWNPSLDVSIPNQRSFALWDGRYWIRLQSSDVHHSLLVTAPTDEGLQELEGTFLLAGRSYKRQRYMVKALLRDLRASKNFHPVPAVIAPPGVASMGPGSILALPTYGLVHPEYLNRMVWDIRYKYINLEPLGAANCHYERAVIAARK